MLVSWVAQAWDDLHKYDSQTIIDAFRDVGLSLPIDGSQDDQIKVRDLPGLEVGDWKSWTPVGGIPQPSDELLDTVALPDLEMQDTVMSNKTLQEVEAEALQEFPEEESEGECI
jgi:hypothetical protein